MRWIIFISLFLVFATGATFARYSSFDTCRWLVVDTASTYSLPETAAMARARADLLVHGVIDPNGLDCLYAWWRVRRHVS